MRNLALVLSSITSCTLFAACGNDAPAVVDAATDAPSSTGCKAAPDKCTGATPVCDTGMDKCVECTAMSHDLCTGVVPVCGADDACRACTQNSECASEVCLDTGACADPTQVAYAQVGAAPANLDCTQTAPCAKVSVALGKGKATVKVKGAIEESIPLGIGAGVQLVTGDVGARILGSTPSGVIVSINSGANVTFADIQIANKAGVLPSVCVESRSGSTGKAKFLKSVVAGCAKGIDFQGTGALTVTRSTVSGNQGVGVNANGGGALTVTQSTVRSNMGGGIVFSGGLFTIENNLIVQNGNSGGNTRGLTLDPAVGTSVFRFNTVAENVTSGTDLAMICVSPITGEFNIFAYNNLAGDCTMNNSLFSNGAALPGTGAGNTTAADAFFGSTDTSNAKYFRLTTNSTAAIDKVATCPSGITADVDGEARPKNGACDLGGDEF